MLTTQEKGDPGGQAWRLLVEQAKPKVNKALPNQVPTSRSLALADDQAKQAGDIAHPWYNISQPGMLLSPLLQLETAPYGSSEGLQQLSLQLFCRGECQSKEDTARVQDHLWSLSACLHQLHQLLGNGVASPGLLSDMVNHVAFCLLQFLNPLIGFQFHGVELRVDIGGIAAVFLTQLGTKVVDDLVQQLRCCGWVSPEKR